MHFRNSYAFQEHFTLMSIICILCIQVVKIATVLKLFLQEAYIKFRLLISVNVNALSHQPSYEGKKNIYIYIYIYFFFSEMHKNM